MSTDTINPKVVVLCTNAEGSKEFHSCTPEVTHAEMLEGKHYELAIDNAVDQGFEKPMVAFDATDQAAKQLIDLDTYLKG